MDRPHEVCRAGHGCGGRTAQALGARHNRQTCNARHTHKHVLQTKVCLDHTASVAALFVRKVGLFAARRRVCQQVPRAHEANYGPERVREHGAGRQRIALCDIGCKYLSVLTDTVHNAQEIIAVEIIGIQRSQLECPELNIRQRVATGGKSRHGDCQRYTVGSEHVRGDVGTVHLNAAQGFQMVKRA
jgi:hypothetical protein